MRNASVAIGSVAWLLAAVVVVACARDSDAPEDRADAADGPGHAAGTGGAAGSAGAGGGDAGRAGTGGSPVVTGGASGAGGEFGRGTVVDGQCVEHAPLDPDADRHCPGRYDPAAFNSHCRKEQPPRRFGPCDGLVLVEYSHVVEKYRCYYDATGRLVGTHHCTDLLMFCGPERQLFGCFVRGRTVRACTSGEQALCSGATDARGN